MSRSNRRYILAAFGCLILTGASQPAQKAKQPKATGQQTNPAAPAAPPTPAYAPYPGYNPDPCYNAHDHDAADLCAQWRAAVAAEKAANQAERATTWSIVSTVLSALALGALIIALRQTERSLAETRRGNRTTMKANARATRQAIASAADTAKALEHAESNAAATAALVQVSAENSERQLRAYLDFDNVEFLRDESRDRGSQIHVAAITTVKNYGHTPGNNLVLKTKLTISDQVGNKYKSAEGLDDLGAIAPTDSIIRRGWFDIERNVWEAVDTRKATITLDLLLTYEDAFGHPRILESTYQSLGTTNLGFVTGTRKGD